MPELMTKLEYLARLASGCSRCDGMRRRSAVLGGANGPAPAKVMFIAEAPGRLGADRTGIPLCGDRSGDNFEYLLDSVGLSRNEIFVTNAVLCNPRDASGRNRRPLPQELHNCATFLRGQIDAVDPPVIATLGSFALQALANIEAHALVLRRDAGSACPWQGRILVPLYHTSPRAQIHRPKELQLRDFVSLAAVVGKVVS
jgi:uracil-DNA glycosylase family 4